MIGCSQNGTGFESTVPKRSLIPLVVAVAAAVAAMGGLETMRESPSPPLAAPAYNALAEGVDLRFHDEAGRLGYALQAARQTRFSDNTIEWSEPSLHWYGGNGGPDWRVEAERGVSPAGGGHLALSGNVMLRRNEAGNSGGLTLTTSSLDIDLVDEVIATDARVEMTSGALRQSAAGLVLHLPEDSLLMLGDVRGGHGRP